MIKGWIVAAALALVIAIAAGAFWAGTRWQSGRDAGDQLASARAVVAAAQQQLTDYGTALHTSTVQFQRDADALHAIAEDYANGETERRAAATALTQRLDAYLAARPAAPACDLDPDGLRLWNDANRGAAAPESRGDGAAAAGATRGPVAADRVPAAAGGRGRPLGDAAAQPRAGDGAVPRVRSAPGGPGAGGALAGTAGSRAARAADALTHPEDRR